jgi:hypothetical protein
MKILNACLLLAAICACVHVPPATVPQPAVVTKTAPESRAILVSMSADSVSMDRWVVRAFHSDGTVDDSINLPATFAAWSPNGRSIAYTDLGLITRTRLNVRSISGRVDTIRIASLSTESQGPYSSWPMWSPSGDAVGVLLSSLTSRPQGQAAYEFVVLNVEPLEIRRRYPIPETLNEIFRSGGTPDQAGWSPDGSAVFLSWLGRMIIIDLANGTLQAVPEPVAAATWAPSGRAIYFLSSPAGTREAINGFFLYELGARNSQRLADSAAIAGAGIRQFPWLTAAVMEASPSGNRIAIGAGFGDSSAVFIYNTTPSAPLDVTKPHVVINVGRQLPVRLEWSPDEQQVAALMVGEPRYSVQTIDLRSKAVRLVTAIQFPRDGVDFVAMVKLLSWTR